MSSRGKLKNLSSAVSYKCKQTALDKFLQIDCKAGKIDIREASFFFNHMLSMSPPPPISCFCTLLGGLVKCKHFSLAISFYKTLNLSGALGPSSNPFILNILLNCYSLTGSPTLPETISPRRRLSSTQIRDLGLSDQSISSNFSSQSPPTGGTYLPPHPVYLVWGFISIAHAIYLFNLSSWRHCTSAPTFPFRFIVLGVYLFS